MPCRGCKWCKSSTVPEFKDDDDEVRFWSHHTPEQFGLKLRRVKLGPNFGAKKGVSDTRKQSVTMLLDPWLKKALIEQAEQRGVGYQTLARMWLAERVQEELKKSS